MANFSVSPHLVAAWCSFKHKFLLVMIIMIMIIIAAADRLTRILQG